MMAPASKEAMVHEYDHAVLLEDLGLTAEQFIDLCILCGCDYMGTIPGIGPVKALALIKEHGNIEEVVKNIDTEKVRRGEIPR